MSTSTAMQRYMRIHLQEPQYTACKVCVHGPKADAGLCRHPDLINEASLDIKHLRAVGGACGIDAKHLDFPGLRLA